MSHTASRIQEESADDVVCGKPSHDTLFVLLSGQRDFTVYAMLYPCGTLSRIKKTAHPVKGLPCRHVNFTLIARIHIVKHGHGCMHLEFGASEAESSRLLEFDGQSDSCNWQALGPERDLASNDKDGREGMTPEVDLCSPHTWALVHKFITHTTLCILLRGQVEL